MARGALRLRPGDEMGTAGRTTGTADNEAHRLSAAAQMHLVSEAGNGGAECDGAGLMATSMKGYARQ